MTNPITTAPADTARAMHAAEMRGQDMQEAPERIWVAGTPQECGQYFPSCVEAEGTWGGVGVEYTRTDLCVTEAEFQRRVDAAVAAERDACAALCRRNAVGVEQGKGYVLSDWTLEMGGMHPGMAYDAAIRARGQK